MRLIISVTSTLIASFAAGAYAQGQFAAPTIAKKPAAKSAEIVFQNAAWTVEREKDAMTDKTSCTGFHAASRRFQLEEREMFISYVGKGGVRGYRLRIDDLPVSKMYLASDTERKISAISIKFAQHGILNAQRIRVEALSVIDTIVNDDISLVGTAEAHAAIVGPMCR